MIRFYKIVDEGARVAIVQLLVGDAGLFQEQIQILDVVTVQVKAFLLGPADVGDVLEIGRHADVCFGDFATAALLRLRCGWYGWQWGCLWEGLKR